MHSKIKIKSPQELFEFIPKLENDLLQQYRKLILNTLPYCSERISYNVLYFKMQKDVCFLWPASILWGRQKTYEGIRFGFVYGNKLQDETNFLDKGTRKQVYWKDVTTFNETDNFVFKDLLLQAVALQRSS